MTEKQKEKKRTGPEPDRVKLTGDWEKVVGAALAKKRPKEGWPTNSKKKDSR